MHLDTVTTPALKRTTKPYAGTAFGCPRDLLDQRFVYTTISPRAGGLSIGVNLSPGKACEYSCVYCEVEHSIPPRDHELEVDVMVQELEATLTLVHSGQITQRPMYQRLPAPLLTLKHVALSGDGEPTVSPHFAEAVHAIVHMRALGKFPFFKLVLITNSTGLDRPEVQEGLRYFTATDEIWAKFDAGTQEYMQRVNKTDFPLEKIVENILLWAKKRPVVIQSLFPAINGTAPTTAEIEEYASRLAEMKCCGAQIPLVQIYSATRPTANSECGHLPLRTLSGIAQTVRRVADLRAEIF
jgi:wyosine [tRNA(Phe)-imidazoG37] synthetase (radical SAM superfamily)